MGKVGELVDRMVQEGVLKGYLREVAKRMIEEGLDLKGLGEHLLLAEHAVHQIPMDSGFEDEIDATTIGISSAVEIFSSYGGVVSESMRAVGEDPSRSDEERTWALLGLLHQPNIGDRGEVFRGLLGVAPAHVAIKALEGLSPNQISEIAPANLSPLLSCNDGAIRTRTFKLMDRIGVTKEGQAQKGRSQERR